MSGTVTKLYVLPGSHPCAAVEAALAAKGIPYKRVDLLPPSQLLVGRLRYGGPTVPGMRIGSERIVGSRRIMRRLDQLVAEPPLLPPPGDPRYARVLEAERWGDEVFQPVPRRLLDASFLRAPSTIESFGGEAKLPLPAFMLRPALPLTARMMAFQNKASDANARADLAALPRQLERIDGWIAEGLLGGERANAADLQIGSSLRLMMCLGDLRPLIAERPAAALTRHFPPMTGAVPAGTLPAEWLAAAAAERAATTTS